MKNLLVWQKLALMGLCFFVPFALVTYHMISSINELAVDFAKKEIMGVDYYGPLSTLLKDMQLHDEMQVDSTTATGALEAKETEMENDLKAVDNVDARLGGELGTTKDWSATRASCVDLLKSRDLTGRESLDRHKEVESQIIALIGQVSDASNLTLDTDLDSYYLMDMVMFKVPELSENVAQASALGLLPTAGPGIAVHPETAEQANRLTILAGYIQQELDNSLARAETANPALKSQLDAPAQASRNLLNAGKVTTNATDFSNAIFGLANQTASSLLGLLNKRIDKLVNQMALTLAGAAILWLFACCIAWMIIRDITAPLREVVGIADQIADGDLVIDTALQSRKDEIGELDLAFGRMVATLKEMVGIAEQIAAGNLAVRVKARSGRDLMGNAFSTMIEKLSALVSQVQKSGIQVNTSVTEIAATAKQQQATASEIAATTAEISATSRQITATSRELVRNMNQVATVAEQSSTLAGSGQAGLSRMEKTMDHVVEAASAINARLAVLSEKAGNINQVVTTITKVADQTNLLSLNAAIEAEKAGEYGRGFSVVATEIRRLADQTAVATYDIEQMVKEIQSAVAAGVMGMDKFSEEVRRGMSEVQQVGGQLTRIIQEVQTLAPRFEAVNEGMQAQSTAAEQITEALAQLSEAAQQTVESLRQSNQVIDGLNQASVGLRSGVSRFKLEN